MKKKSFSISEARANLPAIVHDAERGRPIELTRRGKTVAVVLSLPEFERLKTNRPSFSEAYDEFLKKYPVSEWGLDQEYFESLRDKSPGRPVDL